MLTCSSSHRKLIHPSSHNTALCFCLFTVCVYVCVCVCVCVCVYDLCMYLTAFDTHLAARHYSPVLTSFFFICIFSLSLGCMWFLSIQHPLPLASETEATALIIGTHGPGWVSSGSPYLHSHSDQFKDSMWFVFGVIPWTFLTWTDRRKLFLSSHRAISLQTLRVSLTFCRSVCREEARGRCSEMRDGKL